MEKQFAAIACVLMLANVPSICCSQEDYVRCPRGQVFNGQQLASVPASSRLECAVLCSETAGCVGVNVCPTGTQGKMMCGLMREYQADGCHSLTAASSAACFFMQKQKQPTETTPAMLTTEATTTLSTTTILVCKNGGTPNSTTGRCNCPPKFGGRLCQRLVRDCSEVYENGYTTSVYNGYYVISPSTASASFKVLCEFGWGVGITYPYMRVSSYNFNKNYSTTKAGFGEFTTPNYFIGLDNLHHLLKQGVYELHVYINDLSANGRSVFYNNFTVAAEADGYDLSYDSVSSPTDVHKNARDGFSISKPVRFSTSNRDINGCAGANGGASGWYGTDCSTYSGLFAPTLKWRLSSGTVSAIGLAEFNLLRLNKTVSWVD